MIAAATAASSKPLHGFRLNLFDREYEIRPLASINQRKFNESKASKSYPCQFMHFTADDLSPSILLILLAHFQALKSTERHSHIRFGFPLKCVQSEQRPARA